MDTKSVVYKIATIIQAISAAFGLGIILVAVFLEKTGQTKLALLSGPVVGFLFFLVAISSVVKSFSKK